MCLDFAVNEIIWVFAGPNLSFTSLPHVNIFFNAAFICISRLWIFLFPAITNISSANAWRWQLSGKSTSNKSSRTMFQMIGPRTDPWMQPLVIVFSLTTSAKCNLTILCIILKKNIQLPRTTQSFQPFKEDWPP